MITKGANSLLSILVVAGVCATSPADAASLNVGRFGGPGADATFNALCGGSDNFGCEWAVAEGRAGNRASSGAFERQIFNRISGGVVGGNAAGSTNYNIANPFTLQYNGAGSTTLTYLGGSTTLNGVDFGVSYGGDNPTAPAISLYIRVRDADLSNLVLNTHAFGGLQTIPGGVGYVAVSGVDLTQPWTLTGDALLGSGNNSGSAFQVKVTDLQPVPVPAALPLLGTAMAGLGLIGWRRRNRQAA